MKKALISSAETVSYLSGWNGDTPVYSVIPNACRVAEVADAAFEVYHTLFWVDCADDVAADKFYYDTADSAIHPVPPPAPQPEPVQPVTTGAQDL